jgi:30S ribosomal protein S31
MGRGDKRTRRGKIFKGSYGNVRSQGTESVKRASKTETPAAKKLPPTKKSK